MKKIIESYLVTYINIGRLHCFSISVLSPFVSDLGSIILLTPRMEPDKDGKDHSLVPADPKKSMIHRWCASSDDVMSPDSVPSVTDIGSPVAFSPGMFSIKSPDLLLLKSPPSVSSSWLKSPRSVPELSSEQSSVELSLQDKAEGQQQATNGDGVGHKRYSDQEPASAAATDRDKETTGSFLVAEADTKSGAQTAASSGKYLSAGSGDDSHQDKNDSSVNFQSMSGSSHEEKSGKSDDAYRPRETVKKMTSASSVIRQNEHVSSRHELNYPPGLFSQSLGHHSLALSVESSKDGHIITDVIRRDSYPMSQQSVSHNQQRVTYVPGPHIVPDAACSQSHSLTDLSQWDPFTMPVLSQNSGTSATNQAFPVDKQVYDHGTTATIDVSHSIRHEKPDKQPTESISGEQPAKSRRTLSYPSRSAHLGAGNLSVSEGDYRDKSEFMALLMRTSAILGESGLQFHSVTSSTHPLVQGSEKQLVRARDDSIGSFESPGSLSQGSGIVGLSPFEPYKPFQSQMFRSQSQPNGKQPPALRVADRNQKAEAPVKSQDGCNPGRRSRTAGWMQTKLDANTDTACQSQELTTMHARRYQPYGLRRASSTEVRAASDDASSSDQPQERNVAVTKVNDNSNDAKCPTVKPDMSQNVALLDIHDSQSEGSAHADSTKNDRQICQVCGDLSASFHCGANVCEACKVSLSIL